jgi:hypothetical protein
MNKYIYLGISRLFLNLCVRNNCIVLNIVPRRQRFVCTITISLWINSVIIGREMPLGALCMYIYYYT